MLILYCLFSLNIQFSAELCVCFFFFFRANVISLEPYT